MPKFEKRHQKNKSMSSMSSTLNKNSTKGCNAIYLCILVLFFFFFFFFLTDLDGSTISLLNSSKNIATQSTQAVGAVGCVYGLYLGSYCLLYHFNTNTHTGGVGCLWFVIWMFLVYDGPDNHPSISHSERMYINRSLNDSSSDSKV